MKNIFKCILYMFLIMASMCAITACGGSGGGGTPVATTGKFVDGPVVGLGYNSGIASGLTGADGSFTYLVGGSVKFSVGDIVIGTAVGASTVTPLAFVPGSDATNPQVINIVRFLLSVGNLDLTTGIITIPKNVSDAAKGKTINFATANDAELAALVQVVRPGATFTDEPTATNHLTQCIYTQFQGDYSGGMTNANSNWLIQIKLNPDGSYSGQILNNGETINGTMQAGTFFDVVASGGCRFTGTLDPATGIINGEWVGPVGSTIQGGRFNLRRL